jgi:hypothetical protein
MQSVLKRATLVAAGIVTLVAGTARASVFDVKIPFPFVVQGRTLPAGEYRVERNMSDSSVMLIRGERGNNAGMFVQTTPAAGKDPSGNTPALTFKRDEKQYRLADIWESGSQGREVAARR